MHLAALAVFIESLFAHVYQEGTIVHYRRMMEEEVMMLFILISAAPKGITEIVDSIAYHSFLAWTSCYTYLCLLN